MTSTSSTGHEPGAPRGWTKKFADAGRGIKIAVRSEASFFVHLFVTGVVLVAGTVVGLSPSDWCLVTLCIATVLAAELFNTALERLARAITSQADANVRDALDVSSGAVLATAIGAAVVGMVVIVRPLVAMMN